MSVEFTDPAGVQVVKWVAADLSTVVGLTSKTISFWYYPKTLVSGNALVITDGTGTDTDEYNYVEINVAGGVFYYSHFSTQDGYWTSGNGLTVASAWSNVVFTHNASSSANNALLYVNGVSKALTRTQAPIGTYRSGTATDLYLGSSTAGSAPAGYIADLRFYNVIYTAPQVLSLYNAGAFASSFDTNLVFNAPLTSATALGGAEYNGFTLTSSQKLIDRINCIEGTPSGSPLGSSTNP